MGGAFYNGKKGKVFRLTLDEMRFKQGPTMVFADNNTASGICSNTIKRQRSQSMNGQYFWLIDQVNLNIYRIVWTYGLENLADYLTKRFSAAHHRSVRPYYVQMPNSTRTIRKVNREADETKYARLRGCVDIPDRSVARRRALLVWSLV